MKKKILRKEKDVDSFKASQTKFIENSKLILKIQQRLRSEITEKINKIALIPNNDEIIQSTDLKKTYACGTSKDLVLRKGEIRCNTVIKQYGNIYF